MDSIVASHPPRDGRDSIDWAPLLHGAIARVAKSRGVTPEDIALCICLGIDALPDRAEDIRFYADQWRKGNR